MDIDVEGGKWDLVPICGEKRREVRIRCEEFDIYPWGVYDERMTDGVLKGLKRVRGQIDGIIKMYQDGRDCLDVVTQVTAARAALGSVGKELLSSEAVRCSRNRRHGKLEKTLKQLFRFT